jgi:ATP-dependent Zn protease
MSQLPPNSPLNYATPYTFGPAVPVKKPGGFRKGLFGWLVFIGLAVMLILLAPKGKKATSDLSLGDFHDHLVAGDVQSLTVGTDVVEGQLRSPSTVTGKVPSVSRFRMQLPAGTTGNWSFTNWLLENRHGAQIDASNDSSFLMSFVVPLIPWVLIFGFIWFFVIRNLKKTGTTARLGLPAGPIEVIIVNREPK